MLLLFMKINYTPDTIEDDPAYLNAMLFFIKYAKRNPNLSLEELNRRRRNGNML